MMVSEVYMNDLLSFESQERGFRKRSKPPERQTSKDQRLPELPKRR